MQPTPPVSAFEGVKGWSQVGNVYAVWQQMAARLMPTLYAKQLKIFTIFKGIFFWLLLIFRQELSTLDSPL